MKRLSISITLVLTVLASCVTTAQAAPILVGSPLTAFHTVLQNTGCLRGSGCTVGLRALPGATLVSPVDGVIVRWHVLAETATNFNLQVLRLVKDGAKPEYESVRTSSPQIPEALGLQTFATALPIKAGQTIGLKMTENGAVAAAATAGGREMIFSPPLADGIPQQGLVGGSDQELGFNAVIQVAPTLTSVNPTKGPPSGGNPVSIKGTEFAEVTQVAFGGVPAQSFTVDSEGEITAAPPAGSSAGAVSVAVTTVAGTATLPGAYTYEQAKGEGEKGGGGGGNGSGQGGNGPGGGGGPPAQAAPCRVPNLKGKKLAAARKALAKAHCPVGRVKKRRGATARAGVVVAQSPKPGTSLRAGEKVGLTLGRRPS